MKIAYIIFTILSILSFWTCFGFLLYCYRTHKKKNLFIAIVLITIVIYIIWGYLRNLNKPSWA